MADSRGSGSIWWIVSAPPLPDPERPRHTGPRFFGRRQGRPLRRGGRTLIDALLPRIAIVPPAEGVQLDPATLFPATVKEVWLEIGFGGGEHLAAQATRHRDVGIIGCEVFVNGVAALLGHVEREHLENVRVFSDDVRRLFPALPDACFARIFVLFPDPWPKKRHAERRFIGPENLPVLARLLKDGGELRIATDEPVYKEWAVEQMAAAAEFERITVDPTQRPADWPETRYEAKALREGRQPIYLSFRRRVRA
jgi:tRNA (guanine-N7-)-methyltransferase